MHQHIEPRRRTPRLAWLLAMMAGLVLAVSPAAANVPQLIKDLETAASYKQRLSAAIGLTNQNDQRGVAPMTKALSDSDKNVRAAAAAGLGKLVTSSTKATLKQNALTALDNAAKNDASSVVKKAASKAAAAIRALGGGGASAVAQGGIFVDVPAVAAGAGVGTAALTGRMQKTIAKTLAKQSVLQTTVMTSWPGGKTPSASDLSKAQVDGFQVTGTLTSLTVKSGGGAATVSCKVKLIIATYPAASMFAFLDGGASVQGADTPDEIAISSEDCADAVIESLIVKKVLPTLGTRTGKP